MKVVAKKRAVIRKTLGPGVHLGTVEMVSGRSYRVRLKAGGHARAACDSGVSHGAVLRWKDNGQTVVLTDGERMPLIVGALEAAGAEEPAGEKRVIRGRSVRIEAQDDVTIEVGRIAFKLTKTGAAELKGEKLVIDVAAIMKVLASRVELP